MNWAKGWAYEYRRQSECVNGEKIHMEKLVLCGCWTKERMWVGMFMSIFAVTKSICHGANEGRHVIGRAENVRICGLRMAILGGGWRKGKSAII